MSDPVSKDDQASCDNDFQCKAVIEANSKLNSFEIHIPESLNRIYATMDKNTQSILRELDTIKSNNAVTVKKVDCVLSQIRIDRRIDKKSLKKFVQNENKWIKQEVQIFKKGMLSALKTEHDRGIEISKHIDTLLLKTGIFSGVGLILGILGGFAVTYFVSK